LKAATASACIYILKIGVVMLSKLAVLKYYWRRVIQPTKRNQLFVCFCLHFRRPDLGILSHKPWNGGTRTHHSYFFLIHIVFIIVLVHLRKATNTVFCFVFLLHHYYDPHWVALVYIFSVITISKCCRYHRSPIYGKCLKSTRLGTGGLYVTLLR